MKTLKNIITSLLLGSLGLAVSLIILEACIRMFIPSTRPSSPGWDDRPLFYFRSPTMPSMQDFPYQVPKPEGTFRIAAIGDSFTFAPYMQFTDTYVKKLETMLNLESTTTRRAQVINYGVPAYSTSHEVPVVKRALNDGADLILLQITLNDPEIKHHTPQGLKENMNDRFGPLALSGKLGWLRSHWRSFDFIATRLHNTATHREYVRYFIDLFENPRSFKPFAESMKQIANSAKEANKPIVAVVFPLFGLPLDASYPFQVIHEKVAHLLTDLKIPNLDISPIYKGIPLDRLQVIPGVDRHPNEIAHRMAAERIYLWLEELQVLPNELLITEKFATRLGIDPQRPIPKPSVDAPTHPAVGT